MTGIKAPPTYEVLVDRDGKARIPWLLFFDKLFRGDSGRDWSPQFTNLTKNGTPTITGRLYQLSRAIAYFSVRIIPGTSTSATAGTTYINNFPLKLKEDGACYAVSGLLGSQAGMCDMATNRIYVPSWTAVTVPLTIIGTVEAE